ncbi:KilA-N domain-containing protein [uncultured Halomonas sp.]|uniref:KilA-N domain-containing protein n=1 Tax=uncultured Halomonas sp. TaxID=173971 RepID=UPI002622ECBA|nr:KilA-N domain-containing protein [uncultured Halomonas sp.]
MSNVIPFDYQGQSVRFDKDGWISATDIAKRHGKRLSHWLENDETQLYMASLARHLNIRDSGYLIRAYRGRGGGTWLHPKLAVAFARWIDVDFGVWADMLIDDIVHGRATVRQQFDQACRDLDDQNQRGSLAGSELARHRWVKPSLEQRVAYFRDQLQLRLDVA